MKLTVAGVIADATALASHNNGEYEIVYGDEVTMAVPKAVTNAAEKITECTGWIGTGSVPPGGAAESVKARMVADSAITWSWQVAEWWLALGAENGTLSVASGWQTAGSSVSVTATPADHYVFKQWRGDLDGCEVDGAVATLAMDRKRSVVAEFELVRHKVKIGGGMEMTMPSTGEYDYAYGTMATVTVVNAVQYSGATQFVCTGWSAINVEPTSGVGTQAVFKVQGDAEIAWAWQTNVLALADAVNAEGFDLTTGGAVEWVPEWCDGAPDGEHCAFIRNVGNNTNAWMQTTVDGPGEISFMWRCDLMSKNTKLQFFVDDVAQGVASGSSPWTPVRVTVYGEGTHVLKWRLFTGRSGAASTDVGAVDAVAWTPAVPPTLAEALNTNLTWKTEGDVSWRGVAKDMKLGTRDAWATVTGLGDDETATVETHVYGSGLLMFDWAVSCEEEYDWLELSVDDHVYTYITGDVGWVTDGVEIEGEGWHAVRWTYAKDELDDPELAGENKAMLDNVVWLSEDVPPEEPDEPVKTETESTPVPVPFAEIDAKYRSYLDAANGDYEAAALAIGQNRYPIWECFVAGLDPDRTDSKFTAKIEIVNGKPVVTWNPALNGKTEDGVCIKEGVRVYKLIGSDDLKDWSTVPENCEDAYKFFRVKVDMPLR